MLSKKPAFPDWVLPAPPSPYKKLIRGWVYLAADEVTRFINQPKRYGFLDLCELTINQLPKGYGRYLVEIKVNLNQYNDIVDADFDAKVDFECITIKSALYAKQTFADYQGEVYTHVYNKRRKCFEPNMVFEFTKDTVKIHDHLTQTEYDALLEL